MGFFTFSGCGSDPDGPPTKILAHESLQGLRSVLFVVEVDKAVRRIAAGERIDGDIDFSSVED
jgi:hypothetical protein